MYFCPKCNYSFDISKSIGSENNEENKVNENNNSIDTIPVEPENNKENKVLKKVNDAIKVFEANGNLKNYNAEFKFEELEKNSKFKKLSNENKDKFNILFNNNNNNNITGAQFKCNNCNFTKEITESVLLYQYEVYDKIDKIKSLEDNELTINNPILPRTQDYICKNISCPTNKNNKMKKEAVFFRDNNSYKLNYICGICYHNW